LVECKKITSRLEEIISKDLEMHALVKMYTNVKIKTCNK